MFALALGSVGWVGVAWSSTFRPMPLSTLVQRSTSVVVATPVSSKSHWATLGSTSRVVTDITLEVAWSLRGVDSTGQDIVVRTLGGTVNGITHFSLRRSPASNRPNLLAVLGSGPRRRIARARNGPGALPSRAGQ